jgi:hypothetical protein
MSDSEPVFRETAIDSPVTEVALLIVGIGDHRGTSDRHRFHHRPVYRGYSAPRA